MQMSATARAQAAEKLEQHIGALKRAEVDVRKAIRFARRLQLELTGIHTTTHPPAAGGTVGHSDSTNGNGTPQQHGGPGEQTGRVRRGLGDRDPA